LNNFIVALGVGVFALSLRVPVRAIVRPAACWSRVAWRTAFIIPTTFALGVLFFMWRTWHYTGVFSLFHGTSGYRQGNWQPGLPLETVLERVAHSVMVVLTVNDPPRFDVFSLPVLAGAAVAVLSIGGVPKLRTVPLAAVLFFFAAIAGAFIAYSPPYPGRFSVHLMPVASALAVCGAASLRQRHARVAGLETSLRKTSVMKQ
jgi:hypothetical protein